MRRALALAALLLTAAKPVERPRTYLLSIVNLPLKGNDRLEAFHIDTWGVSVAAVCQIPVGWTITAGGSITPEGEIGGHGSLGSTLLGKANEPELRNLLLVHLWGPLREFVTRPKSKDQPPPFKGKADVETYDDEPDHPHKRSLTYRNIHLTPARACPPIPASRLR